MNMIENFFMILMFTLINNIEITNEAQPAPSPNPLPNILYQIVTSPLPSPFPDVLPMCDRDINDGFIHLSRALNILPLAMKNYNNTVQLWILKLDYKWMRENHYDIRWEWSKTNTTIYPHLYNNTTKQMVIDIKSWTRLINEKWNETPIVNDTWITDGETSYAITTIKQNTFILLFIIISAYFIYL